MKIHVLLAALATAASPEILAATPFYGDMLTIAPGVPIYADGDPNGFASGSWFGCDCDQNGSVDRLTSIPLAQGIIGIVIGAATPPGASHAGAPVAGDTNAIDAPYNFYGNTGSDFTTVGITGSTTTGLDMSGWKWAWDGWPYVNMGSGAWGAGFSDGIGNFAWDGVGGHPYTLDYRATVPTGDPSGLAGLHGISRA